MLAVLLALKTPVILYSLDILIKKLCILDFSDFAKKFDNRPRPKGYSTGHYVIEYVGPEYNQPETPDQKYNRLLMEISELREQVEYGQVILSFYLKRNKLFV